MVAGAILSLIATTNSFILGKDDEAFLKAAWTSVPSSLLLVLAVSVSLRNRRLGLNLGTVGAALGLASTAYQSTFLAGMGTGYIAYGLVGVACWFGMTKLA